ncbi:MAG: segregation/condensation protein A [Thermoanaerobaculia bacterium]|nr:segregation/condensation protein A [Thermoanaerobaculia bacterium]
MTAATETGSGLPAEWRVRLPVFEGPLDLLLHLVRVNEVEISDIPVTLICDQFHEYLGLMEELDLDVAAEYLYEAALLIQLKSRMLLPRRADGDEPEEDPRQELVERLLEYRRLKEASQSLAEIHGLRMGIWTREPDLPDADPDERLDLGEVSLYDLLKAFGQVIERYDREHPHALRLAVETWSVRKQFDRLLERLAPARPIDLLDDLRRRSSRGEAVAAFLAVLELLRLRLVRLHGTGAGELLLYRTDRAVSDEERESVPS